jgi:putative acetyltransferase
MNRDDDLRIRPEASGDHAAIRRVHELAFDGSAEAGLVDALRRNARPYVALVAEANGEAVGHIAFSPVTIGPHETAFVALGLAPLAVLPDLQNKGLGSALVRQGLDECRRHGHDVVVVLGHPHFYPRFGFVAASSRKLECEYPVPEDVFMVAELSPGALAGRCGLVKYGPEFANV